MEREPAEQLLARITVNPQVLVGKPAIRGMRISVEQVLRALAAGQTVQELLEEYPVLEAADISACLLYASHLVEQERIFPLSA